MHLLYADSPPKGVPDIFNAPEEYCEFTRSKVMVKAYLDAMVTEDDRKWLKEQGLMKSKTKKGQDT